MGKREIGKEEGGEGVTSAGLAGRDSCLADTTVLQGPGITVGGEYRRKD